MASSFDMNQTGLATLQFEDAQGNPVAGPNDSVTGQPLVPTITSDAPAVATAGATAATNVQPGQFSCQFTPVAVGTFNAGVAALANSDASPVLETEGPNTGQPFAVPTPIPVTVTAGAAEQFGFTVAAQG